MAKERTIEELRQTKDSVYHHPPSHTDYEFVTHRFTETKLVAYITECLDKIVGRDCMLKVDESMIEDFVKTHNHGK
jgi:hypothetical protein